MSAKAMLNGVDTSSDPGTVQGPLSKFDTFVGGESLTRLPVVTLTCRAACEAGLPRRGLPRYGSASVRATVR